MKGLTIWEQRALAGKSGVPEEAGYQKIFLSGEQEGDLVYLHESEYYYLYWDNEHFNKAFRFIYHVKFQIGKLSGQFLPRPLLGYHISSLRGYILTPEEMKENSRENKLKDKDIDREIQRTKEEANRYYRKREERRKAWQQGQAKQLIYFLFFQPIFTCIEAYFQNLWGGIKSLWDGIFKTLNFLYVLVNSVLFDSLFIEEEVLLLSQALNIKFEKKTKFNSSKINDNLTGLSLLLFFFASFALLVFWSVFSNHFSISDYLIERVKDVYNFSASWTDFLMILRNRGTLRNDDYFALVLILFIWFIFNFLLQLFLYFLSFGISTKIVDRIRKSQYPEFSCTLETLRILIELEREDALSYALQKKYLMIRIDYIASTNLFIPNTYPGSRYRKAWVNNQFRSISAFIRERQCWLYAPGETTLQDLRRDFRMLAKMYIEGSYGSFPYSEEYQPVPLPPRKRWLKALVQWLGFLVPLCLILAALFFSASLPAPLQSPEIQEAFIWIGVAWSLIGIDSYLDLGVLDSIVNIAKGLKELK